MDSQDSEAMIYSGVGMLKCFSKYFHPKFKNVYEALTGAQMHPLPRSKYALAVWFVDCDCRLKSIVCMAFRGSSAKADIGYISHEYSTGDIISIFSYARLLNR